MGKRHDYRMWGSHRLKKQSYLSIQSYSKLSIKHLQDVRHCSNCCEGKDSSFCHHPQVLNGLSLIKLCSSQPVEKVEPKNKKRRRENRSMGNIEKMVGGSQFLVQAHKDLVILAFIQSCQLEEANRWLQFFQDFG